MAISDIDFLRKFDPTGLQGFHLTKFDLIVNLVVEVDEVLGFLEDLFNDGEEARLLAVSDWKRYRGRDEPLLQETFSFPLLKAPKLNAIWNPDTCGFEVVEEEPAVGFPVMDIGIFRDRCRFIAGHMRWL